MKDLHCCSVSLGVPVVNAHTASVAVNTAAAPRVAPRQRVAVPARLTWKDNAGAVRFASVTTRDISETGAFVECGAQAPIPRFRLVHLQLETSPGELPQALRGQRLLAAVWRVESPKAGAGAPSGYGLRFMIDPAQAVADSGTTPHLRPAMAVAS